jgi:hypothetical protein
MSSIDRLKNMINEFITLNERGGELTSEYAQKELLRQKLQDIIIDSVKLGNIKNQNDLDNLFATMTMALNTLKMVPIQAYKKISTK